MDQLTVGIILAVITFAATSITGLFAWFVKKLLKEQEDKMLSLERKQESIEKKQELMSKEITAVKFNYIDRFERVSKDMNAMEKNIIEAITDLAKEIGEKYTSKEFCGFMHGGKDV